MRDIYKQTFDAVHLPPERQEAIRSMLSSRFTEQEDTSVNRKRKRSRVFVVAAAAALALALMGFAFGDQIIQLLGGGRFKAGADENGNFQVSMEIGFATDPVEIRDNQVYFVLDGSNTNITEQCSNETYYQYESMDAGVRRVVLIGGTPDDIGWAEFVWDKSGAVSGGNATYSGELEPEWLTAGKAALQP